MIPKTSSLLNFSAQPHKLSIWWKWTHLLQVLKNRQREQSALPVSPELMIHAGRQFKPIQVLLFPFSIDVPMNSTVSSPELMPQPEGWALVGKNCWTRIQLPQHTPEQEKAILPFPQSNPSLIFCFWNEASYFGVYHQSFRNVLQRIQYSICSEKCFGQTDTSRKQTAYSVISLNKTILVKCRVCPKKLPCWLLMPYVLCTWTISFNLLTSTTSISWWPSNLSPLVQTTCPSTRPYTQLEISIWLICRHLKPKTEFSHFPLPPAHHLKPAPFLSVAPVSVNVTSTPYMILILIPVNHQDRPVCHWSYIHILPLHSQGHYASVDVDF